MKAHRNVKNKVEDKGKSLSDIVLGDKILKTRVMIEAYGMILYSTNS